MASMTAPATASRPTRIELIDALRGFALAGILLVNVGYFASAWHGSGLDDPGFADSADRVASFAVVALAETKFYLLFSFLFGYSFTIQLDSADRAGRAFRGPFLRRLAALAAIGVAHAVLLFAGDILVTYALMGLVLLALRWRGPRQALRLALLLLAAVALVYAVIALALAPASLDSGAIVTDVRAAENGYTGSPASVIEARLSELPDVAFLLLLFQAPTALAMFLFGLAAGKRQLLQRAGQHTSLWRSLRLWGLTLGLPGGVLYAWGLTAAADHPQRSLLTLAADVLLAPALAAGLTATVVLWMLGPHGRGTMRRLAPAR